LNRFRKRHDANQASIIQALEQVGAEVWVVDRPCDLLVWYRQVLHGLEVKIPKGRYTPRQQQDRAEGRAAWIKTVRDPIEALKAIGAVT
jgi:hypothetical protein